MIAISALLFDDEDEALRRRPLQAASKGANFIERVRC
jgi:hypothetical protein